MIRIRVSIDHFGVAGAPLVEALINQSSNMKARTKAFNALFKFAKATRLIETSARPISVSVEIGPRGEQSLVFMALGKIKVEGPTIGIPQIAGTGMLTQKQAD